MTTNALEVSGIRAGYGAVEILHGVSVEVRDREVVAVIGPNGAGKSTLLKAVFGLVEVAHGRVRLRGRDVVGRAPEKLVRDGLAYVPQLHNVFPTLTVEENLDMGAFTRSGGVEEAKARVLDLFPDLAARRSARVSRLSGGQRQMVAIARALVIDPTLVMLDEPTAGLAPALQDAVFRQVRTIAASGTPVLLVEQNAKKALAAADRAYVLDQGRNAREGTGAEVLADPEVRRLYLGEKPT